MKNLSILTALFFSVAFFSSEAYATTPKVELVKRTPKAVHPINSEWKHQLMIYGWLPTIDGTVTYQIPDPEPGEGEEVESSTADKIDLFFMGTYRAEKDKFSIILDAVYLGMSNETDLVGNDNKADSSLDGWLAALYGGYNIVNNRYIRFDVIGGVRYAYLKTEAKVSIIKERTLSETVDLWDGVIGFNGTAYMTEKWFVPYHFDIGAGDSDLTLRASTGLGYGFSWGDIVLAYRYLYYDFAKSKEIQDVEFSGPLVGINFRF